MEGLLVGGFTIFILVAEVNPLINGDSYREAFIKLKLICNVLVIFYYNILINYNMCDRLSVKLNLTCSATCINVSYEINIIQIKFCVTYSITSIILHGNDKYCFHYRQTCFRIENN